VAFAIFSLTSRTIASAARFRICVSLSVSISPPGWRTVTSVMGGLGVPLFPCVGGCGRLAAAVAAPAYEACAGIGPVASALPLPFLLFPVRETRVKFPSLWVAGLGGLACGAMSLCWSSCALPLWGSPTLALGGGIEDRLRAAILVASGAIAIWMAGPTAECIAAVIAAASSWPALVTFSVLTFGLRLSVTFGLRLSTVRGAAVSFFFGCGVGEGSAHRVGAAGGGLAALPRGVADGEGPILASCGGLVFCFLGVVGSVLGADPETARFRPLGRLPGSPCGG
jgi:hypothetical protein